MGSTMLMGKGLQRFVLFHIFTTKLPPAIILSSTLYQEADSFTLVSAIFRAVSHHVTVQNIYINVV